MPEPSILKKVKSFLSAEAVWISFGMPYRTYEEINYLYYNQCQRCPSFENDGCKICGCRVVPNELSPLNKLSMATTNCPDPDNPKWISLITPPETWESEELLQAAFNSLPESLKPAEIKTWEDLKNFRRTTSRCKKC
jgi:hypothetical protein